MCTQEFSTALILLRQQIFNLNPNLMLAWQCGRGNKLKVGMDWTGPRLEVALICSWNFLKIVDKLCINLAI